jgi:hypothetical protein
LEAGGMMEADVRTVDPATLVDIKDVKANMDLPLDERRLDYITQIKNPYSFKCGKAIVKLSFSDTETTLEDCVKRYLMGQST